MRTLLRFAWRSYTISRLFGVPVQVHSTWLLFPFGLLIATCVASYGWVGLLFATALQGILLASLLVHEFAHVLTARTYGCDTRRVLVIPFGAVAELEEIPIEVGELHVAAAGPIASLALAALGFFAASAIDGPWQSAAWHANVILVAFTVLNLTLAAFNLLPCFPMDGGRILRATLAIAIGRLSRRRASSALLLATRIAVRYVARTIAVAAILLTVVYTHLWHHILLFGFLIVAGEVEYWLLCQTSRCHCGELRFLPIFERPRRSDRSRRALRLYPVMKASSRAPGESCQTLGLLRSDEQESAARLIATSVRPFRRNRARGQSP